MTTAMIAFLKELAGPLLTAGVAVWGVLESRRANREVKLREADAERTDGIVKERTELAGENKQLRVDLRAEIERLKVDAAADRAEINALKVSLATANARAVAAETLAASWQQKYEAEIATNVPRELELKSLRDQVAELTRRLDRMPATA